MRTDNPRPAPGGRGIRARPRRGLAAVLAMALAAGLAAAPARPALAATGTLMADGLTAPAGGVWMGSHFWVSDHLNGFCRMDVTAAGTYAINPATCSIAAASPGQPTYDPATQFVYVPDNSSKSRGVFRLTFDPATETVGSPFRLAPAVAYGQFRPNATALGPDGHLYVGSLKSGTIRRITNPAGARQTVQSIGRSASSRGVAGLAFAGSDLYLLDRGSVTVIANAPACRSGCIATSTGIPATAPSAIAAAGTTLYVAETPESASVILSYDVSTATGGEYAAGGTLPDGTAASFQFAGGLSVDPAGNLFIADDPSDGALEGQGRLWVVGSLPPPPAPPPAEPPPTEPPPAEPAPPPAEPAPPPAGVAVLYARNVTGPAGGVFMGGRHWISDHLNGFCRLDPQADGTTAINLPTCNTAAVSAGQPTYDPATQFVYIPDNSSKSRGVWRLTYDPATNTVGNPVLLAPTSGLGSTRPAGSALGPDGHLYVGALKSGSIFRITDPAGASQTVQVIGESSDGGGAGALAFAGSDLYLAEGGAITRIASAPACTGACTATATPISAIAPTAIAAAGSFLFVADTPVSVSRILRYDLGTGTEAEYATAGTMPDGTTASFQFVSGLSVDAAGNLFIADDPTDGGDGAAGHIWAMGAYTPPPPAEPAPPPPGTTAALYAANITAPGGGLVLGGRLWVSDHLNGFCRIDAQPDGSMALNAATCSTAAVSPGQPSFDPATNSVFIPDNSSQSQGVWRLTYDPAAGTVGNPVLLSATTGFGPLRPTASALGPDGSLYLGFIRSGEIWRLANPTGTADTIELVGETASGLGTGSLAFAGSDLFMPELGLTRIANAPACTGNCTAAATAVSAQAPTAVAASGNMLYVADAAGTSAVILRHDLATGAETQYVLAGVMPDGTSASMKFVSALALDAGGNLFIGDDPSDGALEGQGHIWMKAP